MTTSIRCPECRGEFAIPPGRAGRLKIRCPKCSASIAVTVPESKGSPTIPGPPAADPDPDSMTTQEMPRQPAATLPRRPDPKDDETIEESRLPPGSLEPSFQPPRFLGGYRVGRRLGPARSGATYEARRWATGRPSALTVLRPRWAAEARYVARFAREAFAAGLLDHPNLIPTADLGVDRGFAFVASDALAGSSLADPAGRQGFDRSARASAILQAARALRHAHEQGVYHRDLSPGQIRVAPSGLVRLAGVGLGLTPETPESPGNPAIPLAGSPPVVAAGPVEAGFAREDIAGLGRALQILIGGERGDRASTPGLAILARRMLGDGHEAGYSDLGAVVRALEAELGVAEDFLPRDEAAAEFEAAAREFAGAPLAKVRPRLSAALAAALLGFAGLMLVAGRPLNALGVLGFGAIVGASTLLIRGYFGREAWLGRVRELILGGGRGDLLTAGAAVALLVGALAATGLLGFWIFLGVLGVGLAVARHHALDRPLDQARLGAIDRATALIRSLRLTGVSEDSIRRFACRQGGGHWEEFFEALFGYEALRAARTRWGPDAGGRPRPRFARWRDPVADLLDARLDARRDARLKLLFAAIEERNLEARGVNLLTSRRKSRRIGEAIVTFARDYRRGEPGAVGGPLMDALNRVALRPDDYLVAAEADEPAGPPIWREALDAVARVLFGARTRFLLGGACLAGCLLWMHQNALTPTDEIQKAVREAVEDHEKAAGNARDIGREVVARVRGVADAETKTRSLEVLGLSPRVTTRLDGFGLGVAGLILVVSAGFGGLRVAAFAIPGALIAAFGPHLIETGARPLGPTSLLAMAIGAGIFALGVTFGRGRG